MEIVKNTLNVITPFKGRVIDITKNVEVYRCLNRKGKVFSIRQNNKVVGHTTQLTLGESEFIINKASQNRSKLTLTRNTHAFVRGKLKYFDESKDNKFYKVTYDQYADDNFLCYMGSIPINIINADYVIFNNFGVFCTPNDYN